MDTQTEMLWTPEEQSAFQGHAWTQRRVLLCADGRLFGELLYVFNPLELRTAQRVGGSVVSRTIYRDDQEYTSIHVSDEIAARVQGWIGVGWLKESIV